MAKQQKQTSIFREYRPPKSTIRVTWATSTLMLFIGIWLFYCLFTNGKTTLPKSILLTFVASGFTLFSIYSVINSIVSRVIITPDAISSYSVFGKTELPMLDIDSYEDNDSQLILYASRLSKHVCINDSYKDFERIKKWSKERFKDKTLLEKGKERLFMPSNSRLGAKQNWVRNKAICIEKNIKLLNVSACILVLLTICLRKFSPFLFTSLAALLPLILYALYSNSHGIAKFYVGKSGSKPSLSSIGLISSFCLAICALQEHIVSYSLQFWLMFVVISIFLIYLVSRHERLIPCNSKLSVLFPITITVAFCMAYTYATLVLYNHLLDNSQPTVYHTLVKNKWCSYGRYAYFHVTFSPWANKKEDESIKVSSEEYHRIEEGKIVTILQHKGYFGITYYYLQ